LARSRRLTQDNGNQESQLNHPALVHQYTYALYMLVPRWAIATICVCFQTA